MKRLIVYSLFLLLAVSAACSKAKVSPDAPYVYTKYNIISQYRGGQTYVASFLNWTEPGGSRFIFAPNTKVQMGSWRKGPVVHEGFVFKTDDNRLIYYDFQSKDMGDMSKKDYVALITSSSKVSLDGYSSLDRQGIEQGKALPGMTKDGVKCALGYPAKVRTPALSSNTWVYWTDRFGVMSVHFKDNKVVEVKTGP